MAFVPWSAKLGGLAVRSQDTLTWLLENGANFDAKPKTHRANGVSWGMQQARCFINLRVRVCCVYHLRRTLRTGFIKSVRCIGVSAEQQMLLNAQKTTFQRNSYVQTVGDFSTLRVAAQRGRVW